MFGVLVDLIIYGKKNLYRTSFLNRTSIFLGDILIVGFIMFSKRWTSNIH